MFTILIINNIHVYAYVDSINSVEDTKGNNGERGNVIYMRYICICNTCKMLCLLLYRVVDHDEFKITLDITLQFKDKLERWTKYDRFR